MRPSLSVEPPRLLCLTSARTGLKMLALLACFCAATALAACDDSFSPIQSSDRQFSVFGYLDASADTQWVRVTPIRPVALTSPEQVGVTVTLEQLGTGRTIQLHDSTFSFTQSDPELGSEGVYLHNFWTTERIEPGATYRFTARLGDGQPSEAVVKIPTDYDLEVWLKQARSTRGDLVRIVGLRHVALVKATSYFYDNCGAGVDFTLSPIDSVDSDVQMIPIYKQIRGREGCGAPTIEKRELLIVGSGAAWPSGKESGTGRLGVTEVPSNVSGAVGFLGGVLIKRLPYEDCEIESFPPSSDHCRLHYGKEAATLTAVLTDTLCGRRVAGATVRLREIAALPRIRTTTSNRSGEFQIGALEAGRRYALSIRHLVLEAGRFEDEFEEHTDTLEFAPGERISQDIGLRRLGRCPA